MNINQIKKIHFVGIGGIGVSAAAKFFLSRGSIVTGSDVYKSEITKELEKRNVSIFYCHDASNLPEDAELVIYSSAVPESNPERIKAKEIGIRQLSYTEFLGELSLIKKTIAVAGTNGKSTTTAMIAQVMLAAGLDPIVIVGTKVDAFNGNFRAGKSEWLLIEACEWKANMLNLHPQIIALTDLASDHLDFYKNIDDIKRHFQRFIDLLPIENGFLAYNSDDENLNSLVKEKGYQVKNWGILNKEADNLAKCISTERQTQKFIANQSEFSLKVPGAYNIYNALSAITVCRHLQIKDEIIAAALSNFSGSWRRFELLGNLKGAEGVIVISDYAHHPKALKAALKGAKEFYPESRLVAVFQPHHYDRTSKLFKEFTESFHGADLVILTEIYDPFGRQEDGERNVSSKMLAEEMQRIMPAKQVLYASDLADTEKVIKNNVKTGDLLMMIGAGDIDKLARSLV